MDTGEGLTTPDGSQSETVHVIAIGICLTLAGLAALFAGWYGCGACVRRARG